MCNCCGDCCGMLRALKKHPHPAQMVMSNYLAVVDPDLCSACETCVDRCQMDAIALGPEDVAQVDLRRCIGCGLCVTTCPTEAIRLELKPDAQRRDPPQTAQETLMQLAQERGTSLIPLAAMKAAES
jgi:Na+-translocating ferredoxin:NAD+ oxidoreductase RNF subunit RnfB